MSGIRSIFSFAKQNTGLISSAFVLGTAVSFAAPFLSKWGTEEVGFSPKAFGIFMTITSLSAMIVSIGLARLSDFRVSRRKILLLGAACGVGGFSCYAFLRNPVLLLLAGCTLHAVASVCFAQLFSFVREAIRKDTDDSGSASMRISVVRVCFSFSWTLGPAIGATLLIVFGFQGLFLSAAALYLLFMIGIWFFVPTAAPKPLVRQIQIPPLWETLKSRPIALSFISFALIFAANAINMLNLPLALTRTLGGSDKDLGIVFGIGPLAEIPLMLWFGNLAGKGHTLQLIRIGFLITLVYYAGLYFSYAPWHVYLLQILSGASFAILTNVAILYFQDLCPDQLGLATSLFSNAQAFGAMLGMLSFGFLVEGVGHQLSFAVCAAITGIAVGVGVFFRPTVAEV